MTERRDNLNHILLPNSGQTEGYKFPYRVSGEVKIPPRQRAQHAARLQGQINSIKTEMQQVQTRPDADAYPRSVVLEFQGESQYDLATKSLEVPTQGLTLLNVREDEVTHKLYATVRVEDEDALEKLARKIESYRTSDTPTGKPKNRPLVETISDISLARLHAFWTDRSDLFPRDVNQKIWWEVWILDEVGAIENLRAVAGFLRLSSSDRELHLVERTVVLVEAAAAEMERLLERCHVVSEVRRAIEIAPFFSLRSDFMYDQLEQFTQGVSGTNASDIFITILSNTVISGSGPLKTETVPVLSSSFPSTSRISFGNNRAKAFGKVSAIQNFIINSDAESYW